MILYLQDQFNVVTALVLSNAKPNQLAYEAQFEPEQEQKMRVINSAYSIFQFM